MNDDYRRATERHQTAGQAHKLRHSDTNRVLLAVVVGSLISAVGVVFAYHGAPAPSEPVTAATRTSLTSNPLPTPAKPSSDVPQAPIVSPPTPFADDLQSSFDALAATLGGKVGIAFAPVGGGSVEALGAWSSGPAWSTSKVPVIMAALREQGSISPDMNAAITQSDNDAAEAVWASLGDPTTAKTKVERVLADAGDPTSVQSTRTRPGYTAFGQTTWSLADQAAFLANASCDGRAGPVLELMAQIEPGQSWGLGRLSGAAFKGGWGPSESGNYLVRQFGVVSTGRGSVAVAIAAEPSSGAFDDGKQDLDAIAHWISEHTSELPTGKCSG